MAKIRARLFRWQDVDGLGDLERLEWVLGAMPDEALMKRLEEERGRGRNDYPVRPMWNALVAAVVFGHPSVESLRRELMRNGSLRQVCGFDATLGVERAAPSASAFTRFLRRLMERRAEVEAVFDALVEELMRLLPDFGKVLANDGKAVATHAQGHEDHGFPAEPDGRRDVDANWGVKTYAGVKEDGTAWEKVTRWFGYKLHLIVDVRYELPVAYRVTKASEAEQPVARQMYRGVADAHEALLKERCEAAVADKGFEDKRLFEELWDEYEVKPVVPLRALWKDPQETRLVSGQTNVLYNERGEVFCCCISTGELRPMTFAGFEKDRDTLKYRCPAARGGPACPCAGKCPVRGAVRVPLSEDRRIFTPVARETPQWHRLYRQRGAVERVNSRLDVSFGFERHFIRGLAKMQLRMGLALVVMLAMAVGRIQANQSPHVRSLIKAAA